MLAARFEEYAKSRGIDPVDDPMRWATLQLACIAYEKPPKSVTVKIRSEAALFEELVEHWASAVDAGS